LRQHIRGVKNVSPPPPSPAKIKNIWKQITFFR
jgi:hypothetical protein